MHPLVLMALTVPLAARYSVQVQSSTPTTSSQTLMEAGFRMHVYAVPGRPLRAIEWFQAPTGEWVTLRLIPARDAEGVVTAESLTDEGRVEIVRQRRSSIVAESVAVVSAMVKEFADVG